jgi:hypothetical protein
MRKFINIILENGPRPMASPHAGANRGTATRDTADNLDGLIDLTADTSKGELTAAPQQAHAPVSLNLNTNTGGKTRAAMANARMPNLGGNMGNILRDLEAMGARDTMSDDEARAIAGADVDMDMDNADVTTGQPEIPVTADNLPAVINHWVVELGDPDIPQNFNPEWHQIKHLPGYIQTGIRAVARQVFGQFTNTPIEDIQMMASLLNGPSDVQKMASWIVQNGQREDAMTFDFAAQMPEYAAMAGAAEGQVWRACGYQFFIMRDRGGQYIYGWPEEAPQIVNQTGLGIAGGEDMGAIERPMRRLR